MNIRWLVVVASAVLWGFWPLVDTTAAEKLGATPATLSSSRAQGPMPSLDGAIEWLNSKPLSAANLRGKVVLVDFWTYTCINWQRTLPYVRAWAQKYRDKGLVVVGVHTPEFSFEHDVDNVRRAVADLKVGYPVAVDSSYAIWRSFDNNYWPALYVIDAKGMVRHTHFGEGGFEKSERVIQQLLVEAGAHDIGTDLVRVEGTGSQAPADWGNLRSPETYIGHDKADSFASPGGAVPGRPHGYAVPDQLALNTWALAGQWTIEPETARLERGSGRIVHRFHARDVNLVMGPAVRSKPVPFRVLLDGKPPGAARGADVDSEGRGVLTEQRLYQLIRQPGEIGDRRFEVEFLDSGAEAFSFTFG